MFTEPSTIKLYLSKQHLSSILPLINLLVINLTELSDDQSLKCGLSEIHKMNKLGIN